MGNVQSEVSAPRKMLTVERIIAANCDFLPSEDNNILIGVVGISRDETNPLAHQAIRIGNSDLYKLVNFQEGTSTLTYEFEKFYKPIGMASAELDKIDKLYRME